jgi:hypothetical protein
VRTPGAWRPRERAVLGHFDEVIECGREDHVFDLPKIIVERQEFGRFAACPMAGFTASGLEFHRIAQLPGLPFFIRASYFPPMGFDGSRAEYYRQRAAEIRALAAKCKLPDIKWQLEMVAQQYEDLAFSVDSGTLSR